MPGKPLLGVQARMCQWGNSFFPKFWCLLGKTVAGREGGREGECVGGIWRAKTCLASPGSPSTDG